MLRRSAVNYDKVTSEESDDCNSGQKNSKIAVGQIGSPALSGLTPELSRAAKRHRLERIVRPLLLKRAATLRKCSALGEQALHNEVGGAAALCCAVARWTAAKKRAVNLVVAKPDNERIQAPRNANTVRSLLVA